MPGSLATVIRTPEQAAAVNKKRLKEGQPVPIPTHNEIYRRWLWGQAYWKPRNEIIRTYTSMVRLDSPFDGDKDDKAARRQRTGKDGKTQYNVSNFPFDVATLVQSLVANQYPNTSTLPTSAKHTARQMEDFDKFAQAMIDTRMAETDVMMDMAIKLTATGWLVTYTPFDPMLKAQGKFPFDFQVLDAINVLPMLNARRQPIWCCIESEVYGAQLLQDYGMFEGVAELFDDEPNYPADNPLYEKYWQDGFNIWTTKFKLVRYWDSSVTALLVMALEATPQICDWNKALGRLAKKPYASVLHGSGVEDTNEYAGVCLHNLGRVPINIEGCWPEPVSHVADNSLSRGYNFGRIVYYPLLFSAYEPWVLLSQMQSMFHERMLDDIDPPIITDDETFKNTRDRIWRLSDGKKISYEPKPPLGDAFMKFYEEKKMERDSAGFGQLAFGARGGVTSGRMASQLGEAGTVRENIVTRKICRAWASYPTAAVATMIARGGDEEIFASGNNPRYGKTSKDNYAYTTTYKAEALNGVVPRVLVELLDRDAITNPDKIAVFKSLEGQVSDKTRLRKVLHLTNTDEEIAERSKEQRDFKVMQNPDIMNIYAHKATLEAQLENQEEIWKLEDTVDDRQKAYEVEDAKEDALQELALLPEEAQRDALLKQVEMLKQRLGVSDGPPPNNSGPGGMPSGPMSPNSGPPPGMSSPSTPPSGMMPPPPAPGPNLPGPPMMGPPPGMMPPGMMGPPPGAPPGVGPGLAPGVANAPGQAQQPIQPLSRFQPPGGVGRPGVDSLMIGPQGLPGQPVVMPRVAEANQAVAPIGPVPEPTTGHHRNGRRKRGSRGRGRR